jgi:hypothetical protein
MLPIFLYSPERIAASRVDSFSVERRVEEGSVTSQPSGDSGGRW